MNNLRRLSFFVIMVTGVLVFWCSFSLAKMPHLIDHQGTFKDEQGKPAKDGIYVMAFRIYDAKSEGEPLWEESQPVHVQRGMFSVVLGKKNPIVLAFDKPYWLEIKVGLRILSEREEITGAGYAISAETAQKALDSDTVAGIGASTTPQPNKLLPLNKDAKLPSSALRVWDSGWFEVNWSSYYAKVHNLGTTNAIFVLYYATDSKGSNMQEVNLWHDATASGGAGATYGGFISSITPTTVSVRTGRRGVQYYLQSDWQWNSYSSGYYRIIGIAFDEPKA